MTQQELAELNAQFEAKAAVCAGQEARITLEGFISIAERSKVRLQILLDSCAHKGQGFAACCKCPQAQRFCICRHAVMQAWCYYGARHACLQLIGGRITGHAVLRQLAEA